MSTYIHQLSTWPDFIWDDDVVSPVLAQVRNKQGRLNAYMELLGFTQRDDQVLHTYTIETIKSTEIEGELLNSDQVRSSVARQLGIDVAGLVHSNRHVDGVVSMLLDATQNFAQPLTADRLFGWHNALFPTGKSGIHSITTGQWRKGLKGPMQVVSGAIGRERVHFEAPDARKLEHEINAFLDWFNAPSLLDPILKSAVAHLWFVTIHPFDDGNGRIARAITDMQFARADGTYERFYSMSAQIMKERSGYYHILETTQKTSCDITAWVLWFLHCLRGAFDATDETLARIRNKTHFWNKHEQTPINERQRLMLNKLHDGFEGKLNSSKWAKIAKCSPDTSLRDIQDLIDKNILEKESAGGRSTSYVLKF